MKTDRKVRSYAEYVQGNAVRKLQEVPAYPERKAPEQNPQEGAKRTSRQKAAARNRQRALRMSPGYVLFLIGITLATAFVCIQYLNLQSDILNKSEEIVTLEKNISSLVAQNDAVEYTISSYIDMDYVIKVATQELGMVKASESQISLYTRSESEYMKQVQDIPGK